MASRRRIASLPSPPPISVGNCEVSVQARNFTTESNHDGVQISISKTAKIRISVVVVEKVDEGDDARSRGSEKRGNYYFVLANPKDAADETKSLLQEVLTLYMKELPAMNFAANTGKESMFLKRCITNGKYRTIVLKSKDEQSGEVIAAITYQIIPADTQYAEIPLAAVNSIFQHKGIGRLLYLELRRRLQSVGVQTLLCWGDKESEGFWVKQGFSVIGQVTKKGRARKLPIKADIRKSLCFPGGSTLMLSEVPKDNSSESVELLNLCLPTKPPQLEFRNSESTQTTKSNEPPKENNQITQSRCSESENLGTGKFSIDGCQDVSLLPLIIKCSVANATGIQECESKDNEENCSNSVHGTKRRMWETSCTSLKSKKVKGTQSNDCELSSDYSNWTNDGRIANSVDRNYLITIGDKFLHDASQANSGSNSLKENVELQAGNITNEDMGNPKMSYTAKCNRIMLMNIDDEVKKSRLTKIIEDLGGAVASDGCATTHVVTGKVRKTLNFCTALCSGAWVVSPDWLKESFKKGRFVDETPFILNDEDYKTKYRMELKSAVLRARARPGSLLNGLDIWLATHVQPPSDTLSVIVKSAGGNVIRAKNEIIDVSITIHVACEEDMEEALSAVRMGIQTFSSEWLINCIMTQELDLEASQYLESL